MARRRTARTRSKKPAAKPARRRRRRRAPLVRVSEASLAAYAHDIRTALTGILALGELLASSDLGERERRWASSIKDSAEHLAALTTLMIDGARADAGTLRLQHEVFRPRRLLEGLADSLAARAEAKGLSAEVTVAADVPELLVGDAVRLRAALENLIDNAVKFTERGGVRLDVRAGDARRAAASGSSSPSPTAASGSRPPRSSGCSGRSRKPARRLRGAMAAPGSGLPSSNIWPS